MSELISHLLSDNERKLLYRAYALIWHGCTLSNPDVDWFESHFTRGELGSLKTICKLLNERPFYYVHRRGEDADIIQKTLNGYEIRFTIPRPETDEDIKNILASEDIGATEAVCYLESRDLTAREVVSSFMDWHFSAYNPHLSAFNADAYQAFFIGEENISSIAPPEKRYGNTPEETDEIITIRSCEGQKIILKAENFEEALFENPSLHKLVSQIMDKIQSNDCTASLTLDEYMELRNLQNKHDARMRMRQLLLALSGMSIVVKNRKEEYPFPILKYKPDKRKSAYKIIFDNDFLDYARTHGAFIHSVPRELFTLSGNAYWVAAYANLHRNRNIKNANRDIINIGTLRKRTYLPTDTHRRSERQIVIEPLWKAFDKLYERRILYPQLVYPRTGELVRDTSEDWMRAHENLDFLLSLNIRVSWLCNVPNYTAKS